jgi:membrane fusion protein (multidrug efflux system)
VVIDMKPGALLVPPKAVAAVQAVDTGGGVKSDNTVDVRQVKTGVRVGTWWVIDSGLAAGDRVVVEGLQKVRAGMTVNPIAATADDGQSVATSGEGP